VDDVLARRMPAAGSGTIDRRRALRRSDADGLSSKGSSMTTSTRHRRSGEMPLLITITEAARRMGVSRSTAFRAVQAGTFPVRVIRFGQTNYVHRRDLEAFVAGELLPGVE